MMADDFNILKSTVQRIVTKDMCMQKISFKLLLKVMSYTAFIVTEYVAKCSRRAGPSSVHRTFCYRESRSNSRATILDFGNCQRSMMRCSKEVPVEDYLVVYSAWEKSRPPSAS